MRRGVQPSPFGSVIATKRKILGLSQRQLAAQAGLNNATLCKIEKDPSLNPDIRTIRILSPVLGLDYYFLLALCEVIENDKDLRVIARARTNMTPEEKTQMMNLLRTSFPAAFEAAESDGI